MVYGYDTNEEFIDKSYQLLEKLEKKDLWNKDTLVIGLDKSVRPLAYALKKISDVEKRETPDIRFFNYSSKDFPGADSEDFEKISKELKERMKLRKQEGREYKRIRKPENYEKILILDEYASIGETLKTSKKIFEKYFLNMKIKPKIILATLQSDKNSSQDIIYEDIKNPENIFREGSTDTGVSDKYWDKELDKNIIQESIRAPLLRDKYNQSIFLENRRQLSKDINNYLHEKHPEKVSGKSGTLEKIISGIFIFSFLVGLFLSSNSLTGNVIGSSETAHRFLGIILVLIGISGFFVSRKLK